MATRLVIIVMLGFVIALLYPISKAHSAEPGVRPVDVETILDVHRSLDLDVEKFRGYLRPGYEETDLPEAIIVRVVCYSDGSGHMFATPLTSDLWRVITTDGQFELNSQLLNKVGLPTCAEEEERRYGPPYPYDESKPTWAL